jgi:hypothetical protein
MFRTEAPRQEMVYNIKEKPFIASIRQGKYKIIWGSKTSKVITKHYIINFLITIRFLFEI